MVPCGSALLRSTPQVAIMQVVLLSAIGLALMLGMVWQVRGAAGSGLSDFAVFYAGGKFAERGGTLRR